MNRHYSTVLPSLWTGRTGRRLADMAGTDPAARTAQTLAAYLVTTGHASIIGLFYLPLKYIGADLNMTNEEIRAGMRVLRDLEFVDYDEENGLVWVKEYLWYQVGARPLHPSDGKIKSINRQFHNTPDSALLSAFFTRYKHDMHLTPRRGQSPTGSESDPSGGAKKTQERGSKTPRLEHGGETTMHQAHSGGAPTAPPGTPGEGAPGGTRSGQVRSDQVGSGSNVLFPSPSFSSSGEGIQGKGDQPVDNGHGRANGKTTAPDPSHATPEWVVAQWNAMSGVHKFRGKLEGEIAKALRNRISEHKPKTWWINYFEQIQASDYLAGRTETDWVTPLLWALGPKNIGKVQGGYYPNRTPKEGPYSKPGSPGGHSGPVCNYEPGCSLPSHSTIGSERRCIWHHFTERHPEIPATWETFSLWWPKQHPGLRRNWNASQAWERTGAGARMSAAAE